MKNYECLLSDKQEVDTGEILRAAEGDFKGSKRMP